MKPFYITTSIPYVNADPHLGHALEFVQADVLARWSRLTGRPTHFVTGSDENALKNVQAAETAGLPIADFVAQKADRFKDLSRVLDVAYDDFIRTTEERHIKGAQKLWSAFKPEDIYRKEYTGLYCVGCESFKTEKDLVDGLCPIHHTPPEAITENNYFFKLSNYQTQLEQLIKSNQLEIVPDFRRNEILQFLSEGLEDISISRSQERAKGWGVPVPDDPDQVMYVWVDALSNYINALGYGTDSTEFAQWWLDGETMHIVGKDITRFHAIYWPAFLLSANLPTPRRILVHGFITTDGQKMSKSLGNVVDPFALVEKFGADALRFYLLREIPTQDDGDYSEERFISAYNSGLADDLGNLLQRTLVMCANYNQGKVPTLHEGIPLLPTDTFWTDYRASLDKYQLNAALDTVWSLLKVMNQRINEDEPWKTVKTDPDKALGGLRVILEGLAHVSIMLTPFLPTTALRIQSQLKFTSPTLPVAGLLLEDGAELDAPVPLFPKYSTE